MAKRVAVLVGMLAVMLAMAVPAMAQQGPVKLTGEIQGVPSSGGPPVFSITDEATGEQYILDAGEGADYGIYEGRRVSVEGIPRTDPNSGLNFLQVAVVRPLDGPLEKEEISISFALTVEGKVPEGTEFFAGASEQTVGLEDPDGDGVYTGTLTLPEDFADFPVLVAILAGTPEDPVQEIKNFGEVMLEDGETFSASISYPDNGGSSSSGGSGDGSTTKAASKAAVKAGGTETKAETKAGGTETKASGARELPKTGGAVLAVLGAGTLLVSGGLLARRIGR